jgi:16S rRNA (guanine527-N7)-methyltransferase
MNFHEFKNWLSDHRLAHDNATLEKFIHFYQLLEEYGNKFNLTSLKGVDQVIEKHFMDSLLFPLSKKLADKTLLDIGTGAGFPGIPLKLVYPHLKLYLLESNTKKVAFLQDVISKLDLKNVEIINERAENYAKYARDRFDIVTARALAPLNILLELAIPFIKPGGQFWAYKGRSVTEELISAESALIKLQVTLQNKLETYLIDDQYRRYLLVFSKQEPTSILYPRAYAQIKRQPL